MEGKLFILMKAQHQNQSSLNRFRHETDPKKKKRALGGYTALLLVGLMMVGYSFLIAYGYGYVGMVEVIPGFALTLSAIVSLFFTFIKTNGFLFAFQDYDMMMSLPVRTETVITTKFLYMYVSNLLFSLCVMLPMCAGYAIWKHPGIGTYLIWFIGACIGPLLPMTIAAALGALIARIGSRFRFKVLIQVLLSLAFIMAVFSFNFFMSGSGNNTEFLHRVENIGKVMEVKIHQIYPVTILFEKAINEKSIFYIICLIALSILIYGIFVVCVSINYKSINTALMTSTSRSNYKVGELKTRSVMYALVKKEWKRFTSSSTYIMNTGTGMFMAVIVSVACAFVGVDKVLHFLNFGTMQKGFVYVIPFGIAMILTMTCTTCVSLSLEGKNIWIMKSLPIEESMIYKSKMAFNLVLLVPAGIICILCFCVALKPSPTMILLYFFVVFAAIFFSTTFGMWVGKKYPDFKWKNEVEIIKKGTASMLGIFVNLILELLLAVATFVLSTMVDGRVAMIGFAIVLYVVSALFYRNIVRE